MHFFNSHLFFFWPFSWPIWKKSFFCPTQELNPRHPTCKASVILCTSHGCWLSRPYWKVVILIGGLATYYIAYERLGMLIVLTFSISRSQKVISSLTTGSVTWCKYLQTNSAQSRYFISCFLSSLYKVWYLYWKLWRNEIVIYYS